MDRAPRPPVPAGRAANRRTQEASLPHLLLLLSMTTGLLDAVSVLGLGTVFVANMTGNIVFLGFSAVGVPGFAPLSYVVAILAFLAGAAVAGRTGTRLSGRPRAQWLIVAAVMECALLWASAGLALGFDVATAEPRPVLHALIGLTALAMGIRNATVRQLKVPDMTTTVLTLTITGLAADSTLGGGANPNWGRRIASIVAIFIGAAVGAGLVTTLGLAVPLALSGALVLGATLVLAALPETPPARS